MKLKIMIFSLVFSLALSITSCNTVDNSGDSASDEKESITDNTALEDTADSIGEDSSSVDSEDTEDTEKTVDYIELISGKIPSDVDADKLEFLDGDNGNVIVAYTDKDAWVYDLKLDSIISVVDYDDMLAAADIGGRAIEYFKGDTALSLQILNESDIETCIEFTVKTLDEKAEYTVYGFYTLDGSGLNPRGVFRGYYYKDLTFPGSEKGVTIRSVEDYEKLAVSKENGLFSFAKAIVENDISTIAKLSNIKEEVLASWKGMEFSDYSITRLKFEPILEELLLQVNITKSNVEKLPAGSYVITLREGMASPSVEIVSTSIIKEPEVESDATKWLEYWVSNVGWREPEWSILSEDDYVHRMLDFMLYHRNFESSGLTASDFAEFCDKCFGHYLTNIGDEYIQSHGGHGNIYRRHKFVKEARSVNSRIVTVDYYADPMCTVIAYTHEFTLIDNKDGTFKLQSTVRTYDSGFEAYGWST